MIDDDTQNCPPPDILDTLDPGLRRRIEEEAIWVKHVGNLLDDFGMEAIIGAVHVTDKRSLQRIVVYLMATRHDAGGASRPSD